jgi:hypothetical protein
MAEGGRGGRGKVALGKLTAPYIREILKGIQQSK